MFILRGLLPAVLMGGTALAATNPSLPLIPQPRSFIGNEAVKLAHGVDIATAGLNHEDAFAASDLRLSLKERGIRTEAANTPRIHLLRAQNSVAAQLLRQEHIAFDAAMHDEGYAIVPRAGSLYIIGETAAGVFYGAQTVKQLITGQGEDAVLHEARIVDWPAMKYRGLHDDLSRGPVPTLAFQKQQIRTLAAYKINVYSPYFEHTYAYGKNPLPALPGGSLTPEEARELVEYAAQYHITVIPEQEAFGHLHHVLTWEQYAPLAETPQGAVLAPGEAGTLPLIREWFGELAAAFPGPFLHIGADETFDLGKGKTADEVKARGLGAVYLDFLTRIHETLQPLGKRLLFWGDVAMDEPALVKTLPRDMIAVAWKYETPPSGSYDRWIKPFTDAGMETWVAPGVNNWNRVFPNNDTALGNIQGFAADGQRLGAAGLLNTIWYDDGEGLFLETWYGVLFGAAAAWQPGKSDIAQFQEAYGPVFHGDTQGRINEAQRELIAAHGTLMRAGLGDGKDALFWLDPWSPQGREVSARLLPVARELRLHAERALTLIAQARQDPALQQADALAAMDLGARRLDFIGLKFQAAELIVTTYRRLYAGQADPAAQREIARELWIITGVNGRCQDLRDGYSYIKDEFRDVWLRENRPYWLGNVMARYDLAIQSWIARGDQFDAVRHQWATTHTLPRPEDLSLPPEAVHAPGAAQP